MSVPNKEMITSETAMNKYITKMCYIVVFPDKKIKLFKSLRDIQAAINVDSSTISKKLNNKEYLFMAKGSEYVYFINKLSII